MTDSRPLLTIAIPTWERSRFLAEMIHSVLEQAETIDAGCVEIVVVDNASEDDTREVVDRLAWRSPVTVRYFRNDENVGPVRNVLRTLEASRGEFWMFYGDDDQVCAGALAAIVDALRRNPSASVVVFSPHAPGEQDLTLEEVAAGHFYYVGNAGRFALRTAPAQAFLRERGEGFFATSWPQTVLEFAVMRQSGQSRPCTFVPVDSSCSLHHVDNTAYTTYYLVKTALLDLLTSARILRPLVSAEVYQAAKRHVLEREPFPSLVRTILTLAVWSDLPEDVRAARRLMASAVRDAETPERFRLIELWLVLATPRVAKAAWLWTYYHLTRPQDASQILERMRSAGRTAKAKRAGGAATARTYGPSDF